ncbi:MAG TPA: biopolymer transporter ExbD [Luteolibacter sp.]|nr:biopolymer transporter ExbD [Luteolibacter sp.]
MKFNRHLPAPAPMNLVPMIDVLFLLLAFFIISWQFSQSETELNISIPTAEEGADPKQQRGEIIINILADGSIRVESKTVTLPELEVTLASIVKAWKDQPVRLRGDATVPYQRMVEVIDTCQKAGIWNISFATQRPKEEK